MEGINKVRVWSVENYIFGDPEILESCESRQALSFEVGFGVGPFLLVRFYFSVN